jgi:GT2 family glycosyltransferase
MKADVIVLTYGNEDLTLRCFRSLRKCTTGYRLIWLDNGSGPKSIDKVLPEARANPGMVPIWLPQNVGFVKGTNIALKILLEVFNTDAEYIVMLNNDVEVTEGWLDRMRRVFERDIRVKAVGPITSECKSWQSYIHARKMLPVFQIPQGFERLGTGERAIKLDYCYGELAAKCKMLAFFCTVFKTEVFQELGYLDEAFGIGYGDDDDLCKRLRDAKMELAVSLGTYVFHNHQSTFKKMFTPEQIEKLKQERHKTFQEKHGEAATI